MRLRGCQTRAGRRHTDFVELLKPLQVKAEVIDKLRSQGHCLVWRA
jgi:hypothetical protein